VQAELVAAAAAAGRPANLTWPVDRYVRFHQTSGTHGRPLFVFDTADDWKWWMDCWRLVMERAGVGPGDRVLVASSFGPYVGFWSAFEGAVHAGAMAIPSGGVSSGGRLELLRSLDATVLVATPSYALHLAEVAEEAKIDVAALPVRLVVVAGEPGGSVPAVRARIAAAWAADVLDHAGATEVGPWGVGDMHGPGLDVIEPFFHAEFLALDSGRPAAEGELSELPQPRDTPAAASRRSSLACAILRSGRVGPRGTATADRLLIVSPGLAPVDSFSSHPTSRPFPRKNLDAGPSNELELSTAL
jgi:phenylacetate-CoA ligase